MDGEATPATPGDDGDEPAGRPPARRGKVKLPAWAEAMPATLNVDDELEVVARFQFRSLTVALARVHADPFLKIAQRVQLIAQINAQLAGVMSKRRLWLAEQLIKGDASALGESSTGPSLEMRAPDATGTNSGQQISRPAPRRGRPRKR